MLVLQPDKVTKIATPTPLVELGYFGLVSNVILESMHTLYELVCKHTLVDFILNRHLNKRIMRNRPLTYRSVLDARLEICQKLTPDEFQRKVSTTAWVKTWKATEHRQFWVYLAYPLLEDLLRNHPKAGRGSVDQENILQLVV